MKKTRRFYDGSSVGDWNVPPFAVVCPSDPAERAKWGWKQDEQGRWYRELAEGQEVPDLPAEKRRDPQMSRG